MVLCPQCLHRDPPKEVTMKTSYFGLYDFGQRGGSKIADTIECPICGHKLNVSDVA